MNVKWFYLLCYSKALRSLCDVTLRVWKRICLWNKNLVRYNLEYLETDFCVKYVSWLVLFRSMSGLRFVL